jgi:hypothetical protein
LRNALGRTASRLSKMMRLSVVVRSGADIARLVVGEFYSLGIVLHQV